jgi:hypothetical protein
MSPDPKWLDVFASIKPEGNNQLLSRISIEVYYAADTFSATSLVSTIYPEDAIYTLEAMVEQIEDLIEKESGMNSATQYLLVPENYQALRDNGFGQKAIEAMLLRDTQHRTRTIVIVKDSFEEVVKKPLAEDESRLAYEVLNKIEFSPGMSMAAVFPTIKALTHPDILPHLEALIEAKRR